MRASQSDYILRLIEQLGAALARLRGKLAGAGAGAAEEVLDETTRMQRELFGDLWDVISRLDTATAAALVPEKEKLLLWVDILQLEADAARSSGAPATATSSDLRITELRAELEAREALEAGWHFPVV